MIQMKGFALLAIAAVPHSFLVNHYVLVVGQQQQQQEHRPHIRRTQSAVAADALRLPGGGVTMCAKTRTGRYVKRTGILSERRMRRIVDRGGGKIGDPVPGYDKGYVFGRDCQPKRPGDITDPPKVLDCEKCPCGYYDGCNSCFCDSSGGGAGGCTLKFCDEFETPRCEPCPDDPPPSGGSCCDPTTKPSIEKCFEGVECCPNTGEWACSIGDGSYTCGNLILRDGFGEPCKQPPPKCCDPALKPKVEQCFEGIECCPNTGKWACSIGDGSYTCGDLLLREDFGEPCGAEPPPTSCCNPLKEPGQFDNPFCFDGVVCCPDGTWSCSIGDGVSFPCGGEIITSGFGEVCELDCDLCPKGFFDGCNSCDCTTNPDRPLCTSIACGPPEELKPKTCNGGPASPPPDKCCDPAKEPGQNGIGLCDEGHACCPDGTWSCNVGDGVFFPCGGVLIDSGFGQPCDEPSSSCCNPLDEPGQFDNPLCREGSACCPDGTWACGSIGDGKTFSCGGKLISEGFGEVCKLDCEVCPGGFFDGCNTCSCEKDRPFPLCTLRACGPDLEPKTCNETPPNLVVCSLELKICDDGAPVGRDPENDCEFTPCDLDCEVCPGGFYDGCNSCGCNGNEIIGCTDRACEPEELEPKTCSAGLPPTDFCTADVKECPDGSFVGRDPKNGCAFFPCANDSNCCDPSEQPGLSGNSICKEGSACCPDGTWACSIGDGKTFPCGGELITSGFGEPCDDDGTKAKCCNPLKAPGQFGNPFCIEGAACCPDGTWSCSIGDGVSFPCGGEITTEFGEVCKLNCELCPRGYFDGCNSCTCDGADTASCTEKFCMPEQLEPKTCDEQPPDSVVCTQELKICDDGSPVGRDPRNNCEFTPCIVDCKVCPGGFFDGCNNCGCENPERPTCTLKFCEKPEELEPKKCNQKPDDSTCCDPAKRPGADGGPICTDGVTCCEDCCEWSCGIGDGTFPCDSTCGNEEVSCDTCPCGRYNDGCNDCECGDDGSVTCTERRCIWQGIPSCLPCPPPPREECAEATSCETCLDSNCVWTIDTCLPTCEVQDVSCWQPGTDNAAVCAAAAKEKADLEICSKLEDCASCTTTKLSDGAATCQWYFLDSSESGYCGTGGCDFNGICGITDCQRPADPVACTLELKECPDGSVVGRDPKNDCEFAPCELSCKACPGGYSDGCNVCDCTNPDRPLCSLRACQPDDFGPKTCSGKDLVACTADAKVCPDGSSVGRDPDNDCAFFPCPDEK